MPDDFRDDFEFEGRAFGGRGYAPSERHEDEPAFVVDVDGFEGPLDLLLTLARKQQVDLTRVSILALAEQYLAFVEVARRLRLELAADYLVMAAWLAYLKSRLLLPKPAKDDEPSGEMLAEDLAARLQRLQAIRLAGQALMERDQLGRDIFGRGAPEAIVVTREPLWEATIHDLLSAYAQMRTKTAHVHYAPEKRSVWSLGDARDALERLIGRSLDWASLDDYLLTFLSDPKDRRTARASSFAASLELVREGRLDLKQDAPFAPLFLRRKTLLAVVGA